jgi:hypothetical protein
MYGTRDQTVRFVYVISLFVEGRQTHVLCKQRDTMDTGNETAGKKCLQCGQYVISSLPRPVIALPFTSNGPQEHRL